MGRPAFTEAELRRAAKVAAKMGREVVIERGVIRIVDAAPSAPVASQHHEADAGAEDQCDRAFGL